MRLEEKKKITRELSEHLRQAGIIYLTDFTGLDVQAMTEFRNRLSEKGLRYRVVKNTLMRRALQDLDLPDISEHLDGPTGLVLGDDDPVVPAKVVKEFAGEHDDRPVVKVGIVERRTVSPADIGALAELPPRDRLLASIAGGLTASVGGIVWVLGGLVRDIAYMIEQVAERGGESGGAGEVGESTGPAASAEAAEAAGEPGEADDSGQAEDSVEAGEPDRD